MKTLIVITLLFSSTGWGQFFESQPDSDYPENNHSNHQFFAENETAFHEEYVPPDYYEEVSPGNPEAPLPIDNGWFVLVAVGLSLGLGVLVFGKKELGIGD